MQIGFYLTELHQLAKRQRRLTRILISKATNRSPNEAAGAKANLLGAILHLPMLHHHHSHSVSLGIVGNWPSATAWKQFSQFAAHTHTHTRTRAFMSRARPSIESNRFQRNPFIRQLSQTLN